MRCNMNWLLSVLLLLCLALPLRAGAAPDAGTSGPAAEPAAAVRAPAAATATVPTVGAATAPAPTPSPCAAASLPDPAPNSVLASATGADSPLPEAAGSSGGPADAPAAALPTPGSVAPADRVASAVGGSALSIQPELIDSILQSPAVQRLVDRLIADQQTPWSVKLGYSGLGVGVGVVLTILIYGAVQ